MPGKNASATGNSSSRTIAPFDLRVRTVRVPAHEMYISAAAAAAEPAERDGGARRKGERVERNGCRSCSMSEWRTFISGNYASGTHLSLTGQNWGQYCIDQMSGIDRNSHFVKSLSISSSSPPDFTSASKVFESVAKTPNGFMPSRTARAHAL